MSLSFPLLFVFEGNKTDLEQIIGNAVPGMKNITHRLSIILRQKHQNKICTKKYRRAKDIFIVRDKVGKSRKKAHSMPTILLFAIKLEKQATCVAL